jgi:hypothetical protein
MTSESDLEIDLDEFWELAEDSSLIIPDSPALKTEAEFFKSLTLKSHTIPRYIFRSLSLRKPAVLPITQDSIRALRFENLQQEKQIRSEVKFKTRQELKAALAEINAEFEKEIHVIRLEHDKMKEEISKKTREITLLSKFMIDQEVTIAQSRLAYLLKNEAEASPAQLAELHTLKSELNITQVQIEGLKEGAVEYANKTSAAAAKLQELDTQIQGIKNKHKEELKKIENELLAKVEIARVERDKVKKAFETYKQSGWQNIEETEEGLNSKTFLIEQLKNELKVAKEILKKPKLKLRVHDKLEDYVREYELDDELELSPNSIGTSKDLRKRQKGTVEDKNRFFKKFGFNSRFTSFGSDSNTAYSKLHTRRSTVTDGFRTRLSPL